MNEGPTKPACPQSSVHSFQRTIPHSNSIDQLGNVLRVRRTCTQDQTTLCELKLTRGVLLFGNIEEEKKPKKTMGSFPCVPKLLGDRFSPLTCVQSSVPHMTTERSVIQPSSVPLPTVITPAWKKEESKERSVPCPFEDKIPIHLPNRPTGQPAHTSCPPTSMDPGLKHGPSRDPSLSIPGTDSRSWRAPVTSMTRNDHGLCHVPCQPR